MLTKKDLGLLIKKARKLKSQKIGKNYTQKMLATDIGKSQSYIGDIESGRTYPSIVLLTQISKICGVDLSFFIENGKLNNTLDEYIKLNLKDADEERVLKIREEMKRDPGTKIDYIYNHIRDITSSSVCQKDSLYNLFTTPEEVIMFILKHPAIINFCKIDLDKLNKIDTSNYVKDILYLLNLVSYKYKK